MPPPTKQFQELYTNILSIITGFFIAFFLNYIIKENTIYID